MPGAAPTLGAGAAVQGGVTAGMVVANTAISGVKTYNSDVARMAAASGDQVVRYLSEFFAQQGWIGADQECARRGLRTERLRDRYLVKASGPVFQSASFCC